MRDIRELFTADDPMRPELLPVGDGRQLRIGSDRDLSHARRPDIEAHNAWWSDPPGGVTGSRPPVFLGGLARFKSAAFRRPVRFGRVASWRATRRLERDGPQVMAREQIWRLSPDRVGGQRLGWTASQEIVFSVLFYEMGHTRAKRRRWTP
jgi:hypothetical protein